MTKFTKEMLQVIRLVGWDVLIFQVFYRMVTVPVYIWILNRMIRATLEMAGYGFLTVGNIQSYFMQPFTILSMLFLAVFGVLLMTVEVGGLISAFQAAAYNKKIGALEMLAGGIKKAKDQIENRNWKLFGFILLQAFFGNILFLYRVFMRVRPVNFVLEEFISSRSGWIFLLSLAGVAATAILPGIFSVHGCLIEGRRFDDSYRRSQYIIGGRWTETFLPLAKYYIVTVTAFAVVYGVFILTISLAAVEFHYSGQTKIMILSLRDRAELFWLFLAEAAVGLVYYGASTVEYYHYTSEISRRKRWDFGYPGEKFLQRKRVVPALLVVGAINIIFIYDAFRNGMETVDELFTQIPVTAHRGSSKEAPENTMAAIEKAVEEMAEYAEIDVQTAKDGVIVLSHDSTLRRTAGVNRKIRDMTYRELLGIDVGAWFSEEFRGEKIPALSQVMGYAKGRIQLNIELKNEGTDTDLPEAVAEMIREYDMTEQCVVTSLNLNYLKRIKAVNPDILTGYIISAAYGNFYSEEEVDFISIRSSLVDSRMLDRVHEYGKTVHVWTVNSKAELERMKLLRVDNIITDVPVLAKEVIYGDIDEGSVLDYMKLLLR